VTKGKTYRPTRRDRWQKARFRGEGRSVPHRNGVFLERRDLKLSGEIRKVMDDNREAR